MTIPLFIPLAKERAASFRRGVDLFVSYYATQSSGDMWSDLWMIVRPYYRDYMHLTEPSQVDVPLVVENALIWATSRPLQSEDNLRQALALLEDSLAEWSAAWMALTSVLNTRGSSLCANHWFREIVPLAMVRHRQATRSLVESWPVAAEEVEKKALAEIKDGNALSLDEAFARLAGMTKDEWMERVEKHPKRRTLE